MSFRLASVPGSHSELNRLFGPIGFLRSVISVVLTSKMENIGCSDVSISRSALSVISWQSNVLTEAFFPCNSCVPMEEETCAFLYLNAKHGLKSQ
eukprot:1156477-Pelagomonas_calceolata.AAC.1